MFNDLMDTIGYVAKCDPAVGDQPISNRNPA